MMNCFQRSFKSNESNHELIDDSDLLWMFIELLERKDEINKRRVLIQNRVILLEIFGASGSKFSTNY